MNGYQYEAAKEHVRALVNLLDTDGANRVAWFNDRFRRFEDDPGGDMAYRRRVTIAVVLRDASEAIAEGKWPTLR